MNRRQSLLGLIGLGSSLGWMSFAKSAYAVTALNKPHAEWKKILPKNSYAVLFEEDTERPGSSPLNTEKRAGQYLCAACHFPLFKSEFKYDSGTGWPSFFDVLPNAIGKKEDKKLFSSRTEYHCARCGGHQGHVFDDGPKPTGLRYCNNGLALKFIPAGEKLPELRS
jgi:peptide-methionine (R)-S-oxide reductase